MTEPIGAVNVSQVLAAMDMLRQRRAEDAARREREEAREAARRAGRAELIGTIVGAAAGSYFGPPGAIAGASLGRAAGSLYASETGGTPNPQASADLVQAGIGAYSLYSQESQAAADRKAAQGYIASLETQPGVAPPQAYGPAGPQPADPLQAALGPSEAQTGYIQRQDQIESEDPRITALKQSIATSRDPMRTVQLTAGLQSLFAGRGGGEFVPVQTASGVMMVNRTDPRQSYRMGDLPPRAGSDVNDKPVAIYQDQKQVGTASSYTEGSKEVLRLKKESPSSTFSMSFLPTGAPQGKDVERLSPKDIAEMQVIASDRATAPLIRSLQIDPTDLRSKELLVDTLRSPAPLSRDVQDKAVEVLGGREETSKMIKLADAINTAMATPDPALRVAALSNLRQSFAIENRPTTFDESITRAITDVQASVQTGRDVRGEQREAIRLGFEATKAGVEAEKYATDKDEAKAITKASSEVSRKIRDGQMKELTPAAAAEIYGTFPSTEGGRKAAKALIDVLPPSQEWELLEPPPQQFPEKSVVMKNKKTGEYKPLQIGAYGELSKEKATQLESGMRGEFIALTKDHRVVQDSYMRILASATNPSPAGDLALIFNYMKMLDPGSVVRESEFATAENSASVPERVRALYNNILSGTRLGPEEQGSMRVDFIDRATKLYKAQGESYSQFHSAYTKLAERANVDPEDVAIGLSIPTEQLAAYQKRIAESGPPKPTGYIDPTKLNAKQIGDMPISDILRFDPEKTGSMPDELKAALKKRLDEWERSRKNLQ